MQAFSAKSKGSFYFSKYTENSRHLQAKALFTTQWDSYRLCRIFPELCWSFDSCKSGLSCLCRSVQV